MRLRKWKRSSQANFLIHVGRCIEKGYTLAEAIHLQAYQQPTFIETCINRMMTDLASGTPLANTLADAGFPKDVCSFLHFSEQTGDLGHGFQESGHLLQLRVEQKHKLDKVLRYPFFLLWILGVLTYVVLNQLLPSFQQLYESMDIKLPIIAQWLIASSGHFRAVVMLFLIIVFSAACAGVIYLRKTSPHKRMVHLTNLPLASSYARLYLTYSFAFHLGGLLRIGMSVNEALRIIAGQNFQPFFRDEAIKMRTELNSGQRFADIIGTRGFYVKELPAVITNGDAFGRLGDTLFDYSSLLLKKLEEKMTRTLAMIQPVFFLFFGALIIGLFLSILLPMFEIMNGL